METMTDRIRIQVASDLHIEYIKTLERDHSDTAFDRLVAPTDAPILALVGDIGWPVLGRFERFIQTMTERYEHVLLVPGNHEYYDLSNGRKEPLRAMADTALALRQLDDKHANLHVLDDDSVLIDGVRFLGSTLWSRIPDALAPMCAKQINDYRMIYCTARGERLTVEDTNAFHRASVLWLEDQLARARAEGEPVVVLTHHAPSLRSIHKTHALSPVNCAFATNLEHLMVPPVMAWFHGHTHTACDYVVPYPVEPPPPETKDVDDGEPSGGEQDDDDDFHIDDPSAAVCEEKQRKQSATTALGVRVVNNSLGYMEEWPSSGYRKDAVIEIDIALYRSLLRASRSESVTLAHIEDTDPALLAAIDAL